MELNELGYAARRLFCLFFNVYTQLYGCYISAFCNLLWPFMRENRKITEYDVLWLFQVVDGGRFLLGAADGSYIMVNFLNLSTR